MLRKILRGVLIAVAVLVALVVALFAYMFYGEHRGAEQARAFCATVQVGEDPQAVTDRARQAVDPRSALAWQPPEGQPRTLEVLFKGGIPLSAHGCRVQAAEKVTGATYFHTR